MTDDPPIIVDLGSGLIKAGVQTDDLPPVVYPSLLGRPKRRYANQYKENQVFIGDDAHKVGHRLTFSYPIDHGHIEEEKDWLDMEDIFAHLFTKGLQVNPAGRAILLTEPPLASTEHRHKLVEMMIEKFDLAEVNLSIQGVMTLYSTGRTTGLVVEIGEGVTQVVPATDGFMDKSKIHCNEFAGQELTMYLHKLLCDNEYPLWRRADMEFVRLIKETLCYCAMDPAEEDEKTDLDETYTLPDGKVLKDGRTREIVLGPERFYCPEALFNPRLIQRDNPPLPELIWQSVQHSPIHSRKASLAAVIFAGGSSCFRGLPERLEHELKKISPPQARSGVRVIATDDRRFSVWLGAKAFCTPGIRQMQDLLWITKQDWEEEGEKVVARKTPFRS